MHWLSSPRKAWSLSAAQRSVRFPFPPVFPFHSETLGLIRFDWTQSSRSQWFLRASADSYTTHNALVQQGTLPSTGATTHNNYTNFVINNQFTFSPTWVGTLVLGASTLHLTQARNSDLGFALAFPFSSTSNTISGLETFGDNQFITAVTAFSGARGSLPPSIGSPGQAIRVPPAPRSPAVLRLAEPPGPWLVGQPAAGWPGRIPPRQSGAAWKNGSERESV